MIKKNSRIENKQKKTSRPITITTNINPCSYVFVNKANQIALSYLNMGKKMQSKKNKYLKSSSNLLNSEDSPKNEITFNSLKLSNYSNFSMIKNLKTNNISGYNTNRPNYDQKLMNKQDYLIHVNLNRNQTSSISNFILNTKDNDSKNERIKYENNNKNINYMNNSNFTNSICCLSTRNNFYIKKENKLDLKKIKNKKITKKFKILYKENKNNYNNNFFSTFYNINIKKNIKKNLQKSENKNIRKNSAKNIRSEINYEKNNQHWRYNTMDIDENTIKYINDLFNKNKNKNKPKKISSNNYTKILNQINESSFNLKKNENEKKNSIKNINNNENINKHIKNELNSNRNKISITYKNLLNTDKNTFQKQNKKENTKVCYMIKNKKVNNPMIERKVTINKKELYQEIKNKINKNNIPIKNNTKETQRKSLNEKIKEFSKIIVLDGDKDKDKEKYKKTSINFYNKNIMNKTLIINNEDYFNKTKRESLKYNNNIFFNNSKSKEGIQVERIKSFKPRKLNSNSINNILEQKSNKIYTNENSTNISSQKLFVFPNDYNITCFKLLNHKKINHKKPIIKITSNKKKLSFMRPNLNKKFSNTTINNNSEIINKKENIGNKSFYIKKKIINYNSKTHDNNNIEIQNLLFNNENLSKLPIDYDKKFDDLYSVVHRINFGSILIGAESLFSCNSKIYKEYQNYYDSSFIKKYNRINLEEYKVKYLKNINNSSSIKTDFSSSNKNFNINKRNNSIILNEFEISELM